ncbi:hypothetical protein O0I10_006058 [Lichtheimia ornata]|uniref:Acetyl-CoA synthetase-like protein n=1 Tax=Lichtheimia ornata TaxID=688661 RepID=A0AAD7XZB1_9FUNG|nr:uncharacterized protein O0I10_006058 [Lichtheimia ornata]KAJ8658373.1 hypothetical protein O0I10_006058 [Lichtheimia ornata]
MVIYKSQCDPIPIPNLDLYTFLFQDSPFNTQRDRNLPFVIDGKTGKTLSFNQIFDLSGRIASGWNNTVGLNKGDVVAVFAPNQYDHCVLYYSLLAAKCTISPGNPDYTEDEFQHQISTSGAKALVTIPALLPVLERVCAKNNIPKERIFVFGDSSSGYKSFYDLGINQPHVGHPIHGLNGKDDLAFICFSSGTTGLPKGVMLTHHNFIAQMIQVTSFDQNANIASDVILGFLPFYHIFGITSLIFGAFYRANPIVILQKWNIEQFCQLVEKYKVTNVNIVPPIAVQLAKSPVLSKYDLTSLRILGCGAAPLGKEHVEAVQARIPAAIKQGYGSSETCAGCVYQRVGVSPAGSIGYLTANTELMLVDENGNELGDDQEGEVLLRGPVIMKGYLNNPEANAKTFTADGWMRTGDVGKFDTKTGEFYIVDRIKELVKYKGFQVAPAELEALLIKHNDVADSCVVGVYEAAQATELPRAYIVLQPHAKPSPAKAKELMEYVASNVTQYKRLRGGVRFVDAIPKSPSGKILRREVKKWVKEEQEQEGARAKL